MAALDVEADLDQAPLVPARRADFAFWLGLAWIAIVMAAAIGTLTVIAINAPRATTA